jgi:hypothetical protein
MPPRNVKAYGDGAGDADYRDGLGWLGADRRGGDC